MNINENKNKMITSLSNTVHTVITKYLRYNKKQNKI